jgi:hypothetical protein
MTGNRFSGAVSPRDFTGTLLKQQQKQKQQELETVDVTAIQHAAYQRGHDAGFSEGVRWVQENYDVFELEDEDNEE